jgi:DNA-binding response OmpR family regulator
MLSASGQDEDRLIARDLGAHDFLSKPASSHELLDAVGRLLG